MLAFIILVVLIIYIYNTNNKIKQLQEENQRLQSQLILKEDFLEKENNSNTSNVQKVDVMSKEWLKEKHEREMKLSDYVKNEAKKKMSVEEKNRMAIKKEKQERERKNTTILVIGAILIVLSVIIFLTSTWYTIPNILKTIVLALLIIVFFEASKIAKEKFKLEKTSNTFFYIAMAYIPICLFSISLFGLFGEFFSLNGAGKYLYLTFSGIVTSLVFYITYRNHKSKFIFYGSVLSQVFTVVLFSLIFSNNIEFISLNLLLYNILFIILTIEQHDKIKNKYIYSLIPYIVTFMIITILEHVTILIPVNLIALAINYAILEAKEKRKSHAYLFNIVLSVFGIYCIWKNEVRFTESIKMTFSLIYFISMYVLENMFLMSKKKKNMQTSLAITTLVMLQFIFFKIFDYEVMYLRPYIISMFQCIILFITYIKSKEKGKNITSFLIPIYFIITGITFLNDLKLTYHSYIIFALLTFVIGELIQNKKMAKIRKNFFVISNLFIGATYLIVFLENSSEFFNDVIYFILLLVVYIYNYLKEKQYGFKYLAYVTGVFALISGCEFIGISEKFMCLIPTLTLIGLLNLENKFKFLKDDISDIFFAVLKIVSYVYLSILGDALGTISSIALTTYLIYYNSKNKVTIYNNIIPLVGTMPTIFNNSLEPTLQLCIMFLTTIGLTIYASKDRNINLYTIFSGIYLLFTLDVIDIKYIKEILFIIWSLYNWYSMNKQKEKDLFKVLAYLGILRFYNVFVYELELTEYTVFNMLGYIVFAILLIREILKKYMKDIDTIEAVTFIFLYLMAISSYVNEYDGMLFGILIVALIFLSYTKKYGTLFLTSIAALLLNVFLLTREFWFSIPWWLYLLIIGSVLISFAVRNEVNEKNHKLSIKSSLKKLKDKIEK